MLSPYALVRMHALKCLACHAPVLFAYALVRVAWRKHMVPAVLLVHQARAHTHTRAVSLCVGIFAASASRDAFQLNVIVPLGT